jgi:hypothetical protein
MSGKMGEISKKSWEVHPVLDVPDRFPPAVMFAMRDSDPRPEYEKSLQRLVAPRNVNGVDRAEPAVPELLRQEHLRVAWDSTFRQVPGDRLGLLFRNEGRDAGEEEGEAQYTVVIKSDEPEGKRWFVTRATEFEGRIVCWCLQFEVQKGARVAIGLTEENMITLEMP